ncbi:WXG100-like domain-containing protein, partial [Nocardia neocaledoniensis]
MIDLPSGLHWLSILAGMEWPEGNEDEMWAMAEDWRTAADSLRGLVDDIDAAKDAAFKAYPQGEGVDDMLKAFEGMARGDQSVTKLAELFDTLGDSVYQTGTEIEYTKIMFLSSLGLLALEIAAAWVFPPTAPAVQAAAVAATRIVARTIFGRVLAAILRWAAKAASTKLVRYLAQHVAIDTVLGTLQELGAQQWQVDQGHRKEIDWNQVKAAAVSSAAGGAVAGPFGNFLGKKLGDGMAPWLKGAITGTGAGLAGAGGGMLGQFGYEGFTQGWDKAWENLQTAASDPLMWSAGATNGGLSGLNKAGANSAWSSMKPGLFERPSFSSQIRDAMGPGYDLGTFGQGDGAGGDGSSNRPGGEGENRAGADDDGATGVGGDDGVRAGAGEDVMGGEGETRAGAGDDGQSMRPAGATQSPEGEAPAPTNTDEGRANQQSGDDRQSTAEGGGSGAGRQDAKPEVQTGESQAGDGGRQDGGARAEGESSAAQTDSTQDTSRAGEAEQTDGASVGEGTRTDAQSSGQPVTQAGDTQTTNRDTTTQAAGAPVGAGMTGAGPAATGGPS